jgi:hypothetical protein
MASIVNVVMLTEIHAAILTYLRFPDLYTLRLTNHYFHALIPPFSPA